MPAVFVHGVPERAAIWDDLREHLRRDDHIAVALPGFGTPVPGGFDCTMDEYAAWLTAGVESLAAAKGPVDLVGHDWGGLLTLRVASTRPDLVRSWCSDAAGMFDPGASWNAAARILQTEGAGEEFMAGMEAASQADREEAVVPLGVPADRAHLCSLGDPVMHGAILRLYRSATAITTEWGPAVDRAADSRGLVLHGEHDPFQRERSCTRVATRVQARHDVLDGLGHWWLLQDPKGVAARLERFWSEVGW